MDMLYFKGALSETLNKIVRNAKALLTLAEKRNIDLGKQNDKVMKYPWQIVTKFKIWFEQVFACSLKIENSTVEAC